MSEERFDRIERRLERLENGQERLRGDVALVQEGQQVLRTDVAQLGDDQRALRGDFALLREGQQALTIDLQAVKGDVAELHRHMLVLHEHVMGEFRALAESRGPTMPELGREFAPRQPTERRLDVLEAAARHHGKEIDGLKRRRKS